MKKKRWPFYATASFLFLSLSLGAITLITIAVAQEEGQLFLEITVKMYALEPDSGAIVDAENPCQIADTRYGCTADPRRP